MVQTLKRWEKCLGSISHRWAGGAGGAEGAGVREK